MTGAASPHDVAAFRAGGSWRELERVAQAMVASAQDRAGTPLIARLGGGTRLMLALEHRISNDIDLFIRDPQWIGYLTPRLTDRFDALIAGYEEGASSLKIRLAEGEIDFIVAMSLLDLPDEHADDTTFALEPVAEVLAKKLFYRGWALTPRDLFDWWAIETHAPARVPVSAMARLLHGKMPDIEAALRSLTTSPAAARGWDAVRASARPRFDIAVAWAMQRLHQYAGA